MFTEFRLGDVVELRKSHPCGGATWEVVRLGADIGLRCETCGRRVLLPRTTVERRVKRFKARGSEVPVSTDIGAPEVEPVTLTAGMLGVTAGDVLEASRAVDACLLTTFSTGIVRSPVTVAAGDRLRVAETPSPTADTVILEPVDGAAAARFVPGGVRGQPTYEGYTLEIACSVLARSFRPA